MATQSATEIVQTRCFAEADAERQASVMSNAVTRIADPLSAAPTTTFRISFPVISFSLAFGLVDESGESLELRLRQVIARHVEKCGYCV